MCTDALSSQTAKQEQPKLSAGIETVASEQVLEVRKDEKVSSFVCIVCQR